MNDQPNTAEHSDYDFHPAAKLDELKDGQGTSVRIEGHVIGLFKSNNEHFAISDFCPHQGASLSGGYVEDGLVMCPWHAWKFRLNDGAWADSPKSPLRCQTYPIKIVDDQILVGVPKEQPK